MFGGLEGANGGDWEKSLRSSVLQRGIEELSRFSERIWGSSAWQASLSTGNLPFAPSQQPLGTLSSVAEFVESGDELTPAGFSLDGKVGGRRQDIRKALPVLRTPIPHSAVMKPKICTRQDLLCDVHLLGDSESQYPGKNWQSTTRASVYLRHIRSSTDPSWASTNRRKSHVWNSKRSHPFLRQCSYDLLYTKALAEGLKDVVWRSDSHFLFGYCYRIPGGHGAVVGCKGCNIQSGTAKSGFCLLFYAMQTLCFAADFARHLKHIFDASFRSAIQKTVLNPH